MLWVQQKRASKDIQVNKTPGETNPADLGTKELSRADLEKHLRTCNFSYEPGRHPKALIAQVPVPGELGGFSGDDRYQVSRNAKVLSGAWGGQIGTLAGCGPHAPLLSPSEGLAEPL